MQEKELKDRVREIAMPLMLLFLIVVGGELFMMPILSGISYGGIDLSRLLSVIILSAIALTFYRVSNVVKDICDGLAVRVATYIVGGKTPEETLLKPARATVYGITLLLAYRVVFPYMRNIDAGYAGLVALLVFGAVMVMLLRAGGIFSAVEKGEEAGK